MGKQKSFIIVGSTFLAFILIMVLLSVITKGLTETKCNFESDTYIIEVGKTKALAPTLYASGTVEGLEFEYTAEDNSVIKIDKGTSSVGAASVYCWVFSETDANGNVVEKDSRVPHNENDKITIEDDGYWYINGRKTTCKAEKKYSEDEIMSYATRTVNPISVNCFILNGIQTTIPYFEDSVLTKNEETGTWVVNGEDSGISYKGIQITIEALKVGKTKLTAKGMIQDKEVVVTTTIEVALPNPNSVKTDYIDNTKVVKVNEEFNLEYEVMAKADSIAKPLQDVTYSITKGSDLLTNTNGSFKAAGAGECAVRITADRNSFNTGLGKYENKNVTVTIIVLDTTDEQIELIEQARAAIAAIAEASDDKLAEVVAAARTIVDKVEEGNQSAITNIKKLENAEKKLN